MAGVEWSVEWLEWRVARVERVLRVLSACDRLECGSSVECEWREYCLSGVRVEWFECDCKSEE